MNQNKKFHHGNLKAELIEAGHAALNESGVDGLSLRKLAKRVGVSQSAPYRHFESKETLLQELIDGGFAEVALAYEKSAKGAGGPRDRLRAACESYLDFAANRPGLFQLVFESEASLTSTGISSGEDSPSFKLFHQMTINAAPNIPKGRELEATTLCWSIIHGFATLHSHEEIPRKVDVDFLRRVVIDTAIKSIQDMA